MQTCSSQPPQSGTAGPGRHLTGGRPGQSGTKFQIRQTGPSIFRPSPARRGPGAKIGQAGLARCGPDRAENFAFLDGQEIRERAEMGRADGPGRAASRRSGRTNPARADFCSWPGPGRKIDGPDRDPSGPGRATGFGLTCHSVMGT